ncbi:hypothetical protein BASA81_002427 [Batrachochytrium salamandrivorans]|nr:hypothetical protein BASA81_002427 [Batrachochytrium salamandrivorans]
MSLVPGTKTYSNHTRETTLWEDILVDKEILRPDAKLEFQKQALEQAKQRGEQQDFTLEQKLQVISLHGNDEVLDSMEDDLVKDDDDERAMQRFREARIRELKQKQQENKFGGGVETLARDEFVAKVKLASTKEGAGGKPVFVVIELFKEGIPKSEYTSRAVLDLARRHLNTKFVRMVSDQCIENWPDKNVPSIFVYFNGEAVKQLLGYEQCGGGNSAALERILCAVTGSKPQIGQLLGEEEDEGAARRRAADDDF